MAWRVTDLVGVDITKVYTTAEYTLGQRCTARDTVSDTIGEFIFLKGVGSTVVGSWVLISYADHTTTLLADGDIGPVGIAMALTVASTYGWYQTRGKGAGLLVASVGDNAGLYTNATAGSAGATGTGLSEIQTARAAAASGSGGVTAVEIDQPRVGLSAAA
jgi:hypothetical protein